VADVDPGFLGRGWAFSVVATTSGGIGFVSGAASVEQAIKIILETSPGERVMRPEFGCGIWELVMEANTATVRLKLSMVGPGSCQTVASSVRRQHPDVRTNASGRVKARYEHVRLLRIVLLR